ADVISAVGGELLLVIGRNLLSIQNDASLRQSVHPAQNVQDRRFARSGRPDDYAELSFLNSKIHISQRFDVHFSHVIDFFHIFKFHKGHAVTPSLPSLPPHIPGPTEEFSAFRPHV